MDRSKRLRRLDSIGDRRRRSRDLHDDAAADANEDIPAAVQEGIPIAEIARRANYTRKAIYDLLRKLGIDPR